MWRQVLAASTILGFAAPATAHIQLDEPTARISDQKTGPCGAAGSTRGDNVTTFEAGQTIEIKWRETINHPGHYRISFDADGQDDFVDPAAFDDFNTAPSVMLDNIADNNGGSYTQTMTLPMEPCDNCTIQVVQVMTDKAPYGDGNDLYYQCADIRIVAATNPEPDAGMTGEPDAGSTDSDGGTTTPPTGNNTTPTGPNNPAIDDGYIDDGTTDDDPACSAAGGALFSPLLLFLGFFGLRLRRRTE